MWEKQLIRRQHQWRRKGRRWDQVPLQVMEKIMVKKVEAAHEGPMWKISMLQPAEDPEKGHVPWGKMQSVEIPHRSRLPVRAVDQGEEPMQEHFFWKDLWPTVENCSMNLSMVHGGLYIMERTHAGEVCGTVSYGKDRWLLFLDLCDNGSQVLVWSSSFILKMQASMLRILM